MIDMRVMTDHTREYIKRFSGYIDVEGEELVVRMPFPNEEAAERALNNSIQPSTY